MEFDDEIVEEVLSAGSSQLTEKQRTFAELILSRNDEVILEAFDKRCRNGNPGQAVLDYTRALFRFLMPLVDKDEFSRSAKLLVLVVVRVIELINDQKLCTDRKVLECLSFFAQELSSLPCRLLPSVVEAVVSNLEIDGANDEGRSLELLPNCLSIISSSTEPVLVSGEQGDNLQISGREYKEHIVSRFLAIPWSKRLLTRMACMVRELLLDSDQTEDFLKKIFSHMKEVEPQDLPSLVYQLILLASRGHKQVIIHGIMSFFSKLQSSDLQDIAQNGSKSGIDLFRQVEGTVILHINFAVKQDPALGVEWLAVARSIQGAVSPFSVAVLLSLARIQRFEQQCFDILKAAAVRPFQDCERCRDSLWTSSVLGTTCLRTAKDTESSFMRTVQNSAFGWDHIIPSVVQLGFIFIESGAGGRSLPAEDVGRAERATDTQDLGLRILVAAFKVHEIARDEIIEQSKCRIIGLKSQQSTLIIRMLAELVQKYPLLMLDHCSRLKECLDYFTFLPSNPASSIIQALCPLFQLSLDLQDYTILVLRKSMFSREANIRMIAAQGLLDLIIADKQARVLVNKSSESESWLRMSMSEPSSSQSSQQVPRRGMNGRNKNLLQELLGLLRRCLSQQVSVREVLYKRLPSLLLVDPASAEEVFDLVWHHFSHFYEEKEDGAVILKLNDCVVIRNMNLHVEEPLDHLVACVHHLLTLQPQGSPGDDSATAANTFGFTLSEEQDKRQLSSGELLGAAFSKIRKVVQVGSLGDFQLDKTENFSLETVEGERKLEQGRLFLGILEVLMDAAVLELNRVDKESRQNEIKQELKNYLSLFDSLYQIVNQKQHVKASKHLYKASSTAKAPSRRGRKPADSGAQGGNAVQARQVKFAMPRAALDKRVPFLSGSCIAYLLHTATDQEDYELLSFALSSCFRHLKGIARTPSDEKEAQTSLEVHGHDWKMIANPLFRIILLNKTEIASPHSPTENPQEKPKKGRKPSEDLAEGPMLNAVRSLDVLCRIALQRGILPEILRDISLDFNSEVYDDLLDASNIRTFGTMEGTDAKLLHYWISHHMQPLIKELLDHSQFKEIEVLAKLVLLLGQKLPLSMMKKQAVWVTRICKETSVSNVGVALALAALALSLNVPPEDLNFARGLSSELLKVMGFEESQPQESSLNYPIMDSTTKNTLAGLLLQHGEKVLKDVEWLVTKIKTFKPVRRTETRSTIAGFLAAPRRAQLEEMLYTRMEAVVLMLSDFCTLTLPGTLAEQFLKFATHLYKCLAASTKMCIATKGFIQILPSNRFQKLAEVTCTKLTAPLYLFMAVMQRDQHENQSFSKIRREGRTIPNLIYYIEDYERYLIQLSRITKVNLMRHAKRSTARDFKIMDTFKKARTVVHRNSGEAQRRAEEREPDEEREEGEQEEEERTGEQAVAGEEDDEPVNEFPPNEAGVDEEETEDNVVEDIEPVEIGAGDGDHEENDAVVEDSDEEGIQAVPLHVSESRQHSRGSALKRRSRVVDSDEGSDDDLPVSHKVSAKRQRSL